MEKLQHKWLNKAVNQDTLCQVLLKQWLNRHVKFSCFSISTAQLYQLQHVFGQSVKSIWYNGGWAWVSHHVASSLKCNTITTLSAIADGIMEAQHLLQQKVLRRNILTTTVSVQARRFSSTETRKEVTLMTPSKTFGFSLLSMSELSTKLMQTFSVNSLARFSIAKPLPLAQGFCVT